MLGAVMLSPAAGGLGVWLVGDHFGHDGSLLASILGNYIGARALPLAFACLAGDETICYLAVAVQEVLGAVGAVVGYTLTDDLPPVTLGVLTGGEDLAVGLVFGVTLE